MNTKQYVLELKVDDGDKDPNQFPFNLPAIRDLRNLKLHPEVTFFVGENGTGKSTLLEATAVAFGLNAEGGSRNVRFSTRASHSELHKHLRLVKGIRAPRDSFFLRSESVFNLATELENLDGGRWGMDRLTGTNRFMNSLMENRSTRYS